MVAGAASVRSLGSPSRADVVGWSSPIRFSALSFSGLRGGGGSTLATCSGAAADGAISAGDAESEAGGAGSAAVAGDTGGLRGGFGGWGGVASASASGVLGGSGAG